MSSEIFLILDEICNIRAGVSGSGIVGVLIRYLDDHLVLIYFSDLSRSLK